jgi:hypothetical protein
MAYYQISSFYYDNATNNIIVQFVNYKPLEYEVTDPMDQPYDVLEAQIYLDAGKTKIGEYIPASADGTVQIQFLGRQPGQAPDVQPTEPLPGGEQPA